MQYIYIIPLDEYNTAIEVKDKKYVGGRFKYFAVSTSKGNAAIDIPLLFDR